jgi:hypothetical protein
MVGILLCRTVISCFLTVYFRAALGKITHPVFLINRSPIKKKENLSAGNGGKRQVIAGKQDLRVTRDR